MLIDISNIQEYQNVLESTVIVVVGLFMHLNRISIIELKYSRLPLLSPNFASSLFVLSVLCILAKMRPLWPAALRKPQRLLIFIMELALILYATDFFLRQVWVPSLKLLNFVCRFLGQYVIVANEAFLANNAPTLSSWIRNDAFYIARFLLAVIVFLFMIDTTGILEFVLSKFYTYDANGSFFPVREARRNRLDSETYMYEAPMMESEMPMTSGAGLGQVDTSNFDVNELPFVPQEDLLNLGHRVGARRRRQPMRKAKRAKIMLTEPENECTC